MVLPAILEIGTYPSRIVWNSSLAMYRDYPWDPVNLSVSVIASQPYVNKIAPSTVSARGGGTVQIVIVGFPPALRAADLSIQLGREQLSLASDPVADVSSAILSFVAPARAAGFYYLSVYYASGLRNQPQAFAAAANLNFYSDDTSLTCVEGCVFGLGRRELNATLEVRTNRDTTAPAVNQTGIGCTYLLNDHDLRTCSAGVRVVGTKYNCGQAAASSCFRLFVRYSISRNESSQLTAPFTNGFLSVSILPLQASSMLTFVRFQRPPAMTGAQFSSNWASIRVSFDQPVATGPWAGCSLVLQTERLGLGPSCLWPDLQTLLVVLGRDAALVPGDPLVLREGLSDSSLLAATVAQQTIAVSQPSEIDIPQIAVSGPNVVSSCDVALISVATTSSRNSYIWGCRNDYVLDGIVGINAGWELYLNGSLLEIGRVYVITVQVRTFYGVFSSIATHTVSLSLLPLPLVTIDLPTPPLYRSRDIYIEGSLTYSKCSPQSVLQYSWEVSTLETTQNGTAGTVVLWYTDPVLYIAPGTLKANQNYQVALKAGAPGQAAGTSAVSFTTQAESVIAVIAGGNRYAYKEDRISLDGSQSRDPDRCLNTDVGCDSTKTLSFVWECFQGDFEPCLYKNGSRFIPVRVPMYLLDLGQFSLPGTSEVLIKLTVFKHGNSDSTSILVGISESVVMNVQIVNLYFTESRIAFQGLAADPASVFNWTVQRSKGDNQGLLDTRDSATFFTGISGSTFAFRTETPVGADLFRGGQSYKVAVRASSQAGAGYSWLEFSIPLPPTSGVCSVGPGSGHSLETEFSIVCKDWQGSYLPLSYSFASASASIAGLSDPSITWSPLTAASAFQTYLPEGNFSCLVKIVDALGYSTAVSAGTAKVSARGGVAVDTKAMGSIFSQYDGLARSSQTLMLADSVAVNINSVKGIQCGSSACRRLLGSSKAYRLEMRRLLLKALSGTVLTTMSRRNAPSMLKAVKRIAVPTELSSGSLDLLYQQLVVFEYLDVKALQSGALTDMITLTAGIVDSARSTMEAEQLDVFCVRIISSIMSASHKIWTGMFRNENPLALQANSVALDINPSLAVNKQPDSIIIPDSSLNVTRRTISSSSVGYAVVRLRSLPQQHEDPNVTLGPAIQQSDIFAVSVWNMADDVQKQQLGGSSWPCPDENQSCITFSVAFPGSLDQDTDAACVSWTGTAWLASSTCAARARSVEAQVLVECLCRGAGVFKAVLTPASLTVQEARPFVSTVAFDPHVSSLWSVSAVALLWLAMMAAVFRVVARSLRRVGRMDCFLEFEHVEGDWFDDETHHELRERVMHRTLSRKPSRRRSKQPEEGRLKPIEVPANDLAISARFAHGLHLEAFSPPICFLDLD